MDARRAGREAGKPRRIAQPPGSGMSGIGDGMKANMEARKKLARTRGGRRTAVASGSRIGETEVLRWAGRIVRRGADGPRRAGAGRATSAATPRSSMREEEQMAATAFVGTLRLRSLRGNGLTLSASPWPPSHEGGFPCQPSRRRRPVSAANAPRIPSLASTQLIPLHPLPDGRPDGRARHRPSQPLSGLPLEPSRRRRPGRPGIRLPPSMEPIAITVRNDGEWVLIHRCRGCGELLEPHGRGRQPAAARAPRGEALAQPPFPLDRLALI